MLGIDVSLGRVLIKQAATHPGALGVGSAPESGAEADAAGDPSRTNNGSRQPGSMTWFASERIPIASSALVPALLLQVGHLRLESIILAGRTRLEAHAEPCGVAARHR
jgi:hypothetical protein